VPVNPFTGCCPPVKWCRFRPRRSVAYRDLEESLTAAGASMSDTAADKLRRVKLIPSSPMKSLTGHRGRTALASTGNSCSRTEQPCRPF
jgi:hypothetical protein